MLFCHWLGDTCRTFVLQAVEKCDIVKGTESHISIKQFDFVKKKKKKKKKKKINQPHLIRLQRYEKALSFNIHPRHLTQSSSHSIRLCACYKCEHFHTTYARMKYLCTGRKSNFAADASIVRVQNITISSCR